MPPVHRTALQANHPADCMNCDASGRCELQVSSWSVGDYVRLS